MIIITLLFFFAGVAHAQNTLIDGLRTQFNQLNDSGRYYEALDVADKITDYWQNAGEADSADFYRNRRISTLFKIGNYAEALKESEALTVGLKARGLPPDFMGSVYFNAGQCLLLTSQFENADDAFNACLAFEKQRSHPDTNNIASATEWKGILRYYLDSLPEAQKLAEEALKLRYAVNDSSSMDVAYTLNTLAIIYRGRGLMSRALKTSEEVYRIFKLQLPSDHPQLLTTAMNLSINKADMGEISEAIALLESAITENEKNGRAYDLMMQYYDLGSTYDNSLLDYEHGRIFYLKSLHLADSILPKPHAIRATIYDGIAGSYLAGREYLKADSCYRLALIESKKLEPVSLKDLGRITCNIGGNAAQMGDTARAIDYFNQSLNYYTAAVGENDPFTANVRNELATFEWIDGKHEKALNTFRNSLRIFTQTFTSRNAYTLETTLKIARCFHEIQLADSTRKYLQKAWAGVCDIEDMAINLEKLDDYQVVFVDLTVLELVELNLDILLRNKDFAGNESMAEGIALMKTMDHLMVKLWPLLNFNNESSSTLPRIKRIYRKGAFLASRNKTEDPRVRTLLLNCLQQSQSASIRSALQNREAMRYSNVPDSIVDKDRKLREKLRFIKASEMVKDQNEDRTKSLKYETFNAWRSFQKQLQEQYPQWYRARYAPDTPNIANTRQRLAKSGSSLVAYFVGDTSMVVLSMDGDRFHTTASTLPAAWRDSVRTYRNLIEQRAIASRLAPLSYYLYTLFWRPVERQVNDYVMLLPDGALHFLNFETLISAMPKSENYADWDWLIKKHTFLYRNDLPGKEKHREEQGGGILALAPGFSDDLKAKYRELDSSNTSETKFTDWVQTPWSEAFVEELEPKGKVFVGVNATKAAFRKNAADAGILHFATHAQLNDMKPLNSYLALTPQRGDSDNGRLYAYELYDQPLSARLAVLTACETGIGEYREGDGVISLGHAFQYAGCPNVVYSLWQIDDKQSTWLMRQFYARMDEGQTFSGALRQAKLDYLSQHSDELNAPYYWGGVILTGQDDKLPPRRGLAGRFWWTLLFIVPIIIVAARRNNKKRDRE